MADQTKKPTPLHASGLSPFRRRDLVRFACRVAWLDGGPQPQEKRLIRRLADRLGIEPDDDLRLAAWLERGPPEVDLDLAAMDPAERRLFLAVATAIADADSVRHPDEARALAWLSRSIRQIEADRPAMAEPLGASLPAGSND